MIDRKTVTVGTDAELPLVIKGSDTFFPVTGLVGGSKQKPVPLHGLGKGFTVQEDNVNVEFNIPAAKNEKEFTAYILKAIDAVRKTLPPTLELRKQSSMTYAAGMLDNEPCQTFGCDPDFNVYTTEENPRPKVDDPLFRTAAAHVHVGWANPNNEDRFHLVKMLDLTLGLTFRKHDDLHRRVLYGKAGAFRPKEYGVEYRTLGNWWVFRHTGLIYNHVLYAVDLVNRGLVLSPEQEQAVQAAINTGEVGDVVGKLAGEWGFYP